MEPSPVGVCPLTGTGRGYAQAHSCGGGLDGSAREPILDEVAWRLASTGTTDARGRARLASRPGGYLVAVHAEGHAPLRRQVLEPGHCLTGRTVVAGSNEPLPLVELVLTAQADTPDIRFRPDAPAEERVYATSSERGDFHLEGLSSGVYLLMS